MNHNDLIKRIHDEAMKTGMPPDITSKFWNYDINERRKDMDRRSGNWEIETTVKMATISKFFKRLFGWKNK